MSSPQLENGYTKIANEIMEALSKYRIPGEQMQCLLFLLRKTYGYNKVCDRISNSQYVVGTGINKRNVKRALDGLIEKRTVVKKDNEYIPTYQFNKDYRLWRLLSKKTTSCQKRPKQLSKKTDTKEILQKKKRRVFVPPELQAVISYFKENGYSTETAKRVYQGYNEADWYDSRGNKILNWKQKMVHVWFKDENKAPVQTLQKPLTMEDVKNGKLEKNG